MSNEQGIGNELMVEGTANEHTEDDFEVIDEVAERERNLQPSVEQEVRATVDYSDDNPLDRGLFGQTLDVAARKWEIQRTRRPWDRQRETIVPSGDYRVLMSYDGPRQRSSASALTANGGSTSTHPVGTPSLSSSTPEGSTTEAVAPSRV